MAKLRLDLDWRTTLVTALLLPALVGLGLWQLQRADEKAAIGQRVEQRRALPPVAIQAVNPGTPESLEYLPVSLRGHLVPGKYFLLDNRIYRGKFGYEVIGIFRLEGDRLSVLVNRGWIAGDSARRELPQVPELAEPVTITGHIYVAPGAPYLLADTPLEPGWPKRIQAIEMEKLAPVAVEVASSPLFPYPVRLDQGVPGALTIDWQVVNASPAKHTGYAVQWFTMAAALFILFILRSSNLWQVVTGGTGARE